MVVATSCQKGDLLSNPNAAGETSIISPGLLVNHVTYDIYNGGGVMDSRPGAVSESPWDQEFIWSQYFVSNYPYYRGNNFYNWSRTSTAYDILRYAVKIEDQVAKQYPTTPSNKVVYSALAKFFRAYAFIWYTQRVGDIPMTEAGNPNNLTPKFDTQKQVYINSLNLLDSANIILGNLIATYPTGIGSVKGSAILDAGDIYGLTNLQWQKLINTYRLRVLISLSKRAGDNADMNIKQQFATIINNPATYPIMTGNTDNMVFKYNASYNAYPIFLRGNNPYNNYANISKTYLNLTTANRDPRTFVVATPAPAQLTAGKTVGDFTAYVGADINTDISTLFNTGSTPATSQYSYANYLRYYSDKGGANCEPDVVIGYPEMCFNIAEAINLGWVTGSSATWYTNGINASLSIYGLTQGQTFTVADVAGKTLGTVTIDINTFLSNVAYAGDNATGLNQILTQKYIALFNNSGWESFYNWRRTGVPTFSQGGAGIGVPANNNLIPRRWQYPLDEFDYNGANCTAAIQSQYGGVDDLSKDTWLTK
ncbi:hypothetical protein F5148DRAFT_1291784 [Russula earlei]|uniref:Uncharacterized protein n=1 Tax=Russula earlei TaxID=71964 RepID=A0ACC0TU02_9AGAM|nr:hypothetical protein F5148DRAFT_1291784 [Russula earlei]